MSYRKDLFLHMRGFEACNRCMNRLYNPPIAESPQARRPFARTRNTGFHKFRSQGPSKHWDMMLSLAAAIGLQFLLLLLNHV